MNLPTQYRAKHQDNNNWMYGYFVRYPDGSAAIFPQKNWESFPVKPDTVSVFTGIILRGQEKMLYTGDVVEMYGKNYVLEFRGGSFGVWDGKTFISYSTSWEHLGNIYDNPELAPNFVPGLVSNAYN